MAGSVGSLWTLAVKEKKLERFGDVRSTSPFNAEFSPDGRWMAYTLRTGDSANVYVEPIPATGSKFQITTRNGHHPIWMPDGKGLSFRVAPASATQSSLSQTLEVQVVLNWFEELKRLVSSQ